MPVRSGHYHQLNFRPAFCPEHAIAGQKVAILRLNMQIDIKRVSSRTDGNNFTNFNYGRALPILPAHPAASLHSNSRLWWVNR